VITDKKSERKLLEAYVALSRVSSMDDILILRPFTDNLIEARQSSELKTFIVMLQTKARTTKERLEQLLPKRLYEDCNSLTRNP
jgi:hypothetical protein